MVDLGLLSMAFTAIIAACWAWESRKTKGRIDRLEGILAEMKQR